MEFVKMQSTGNDFIIFNGESNIEFKQSKDISERVRNLCDRHFGIGGDGLMFSESSDIADIKMNYYNSDGSIAELCGNGIRCFAKFVFEKSLVLREEFSIETLAGIMRVKLFLNENIVENISVNIGKPVFRSDLIPIKTEMDQKNNLMIEEEIEINGQKFKMHIVKVGVPHAVIFVENILDSDIAYIGNKIENYGLFPEKINVNFVKINSKNNIEIFTWERGVGRTLACGTGACAALTAGVEKKILDKRVLVNTDGGTLQVEIKEDQEIFLTGEAVIVFRGIIDRRKV